MDLAEIFVRTKLFSAWGDDRRQERCHLSFMDIHRPRTGEADELSRADRFREAWDRQFAALSPGEKELIIANPMGLETDRLTEAVEAVLASKAGKQ